MLEARVFLLAPVLGALACGGNVIVDGTSSAGGSPSTSSCSTCL